MRNKKNVPDIRFKGFTEEWMPISLCELSEPLEYGLNAPAAAYDGVNKYIRITDIDDDTHMLNLNGLTSPNANLSLSTNYQLMIGDIVFARTGASVGKSYHYKETDGLVYYAGFLIRARIKSNINSEFVFQNTLTSRYDKFVKITSQRSGQPGINAQEYSSWELTIPKSADEQKAIGNYFQNIDRLIVASQTKLDKLKTIKKACLEKMFPRNGSNIPEIRFKGFAEEWSKDPIGNMGNPFNGLTGKTKEDFGHGRAKFITYMNVFSNPISNLTQTENVEIDNKQNSVIYGDILFTVSSETPEEVGMSSVWLSNEENVYLNSFCFGYRLYKPKYSYFMAYVLRSKYMRKKIAILAQGISRYNISKGKVMEIDLPFPKYDEQQAIGNYFRDIDKLITLTEQKIEKLKNIKKACLDKMFVNTEDRYDTI